MAEAAPREPNLLSMYQDMFLTHQKIFPYGHFAELLTQAARTVMDAQITYAQSLMSANAAILGAWTDNRKQSGEIGPCEAAKKPEYMSA